jgi:hypothetical protein
MKTYRALVVDLTILASQEFSVGERTDSSLDHFTIMQRVHSIHLTVDWVRSIIVWMLGRNEQSFPSEIQHRSPSYPAVGYAFSAGRF